MKQNRAVWCGAAIKRSTTNSSRHLPPEEAVVRLELSPWGRIRFKELLHPLHSKILEAEVRAGWV